MPDFKKSLAKLNKYHLLQLLILVLAIALRFYKLGQVPHGMTVDEAAIGYNGYAILNYRRDEWLNRLPISFTSFGDFKAPFSIYLNGLFTYLFGMNLYAVRLPFALFSIVAIFFFMELVKLLLNHYSNLSKDNVAMISLWSGLLMTLSPWHHHFSRVGFESGIALSITILAVYFIELYYLAVKNKEKNKIIYLLLSSLFFSLTFYTYHSSKLVTPLVLIALYFTNKKIHKKNIKDSIKYLIFFLLFSTPFIYDSLFGNSLNRAQALVIMQDLPLLEKISVIFKNILSHLSPNFLVLGETFTLRHGSGKWGVLMPLTFLLLLVQVWKLFIRILNKAKTFFVNKRVLILSTIIILIGMSPAFLGAEYPHSNRALLAAPGFYLVAAYILNASCLNLSKRKKTLMIVNILAVMFVQTYLYQYYYYTGFAAKSSADFNDGMIEAFEEVNKIKAENPDIIQVMFTSNYGQPYIYGLFVNKISPQDYQWGAQRYYWWADNIEVSDLFRKNNIIVASAEDDMPLEDAKKIIYGSDGEPRFIIYMGK